MSLFTPDELFDGEYAIAAEMNAMFTAIATILNGGIVDENVDAAAAITPSKIAGGAPVKIATTVAGLGTPFDGMTGLLRLGSTPYEFLAVVYDATYGKFVSAPVWCSHSVEDAAEYLVNYTAGYLDTPCQLSVKGYKAIYDAGMRLQVAYACKLFCSDGVHEARVGVNVYDKAASDNAYSTLTTGYDAQATLTTAYLTREWAQPSVTPTQTHGHLALGCQLQAPGGGGAYALIREMSLGYRFVSA